MTHLYRTPLLIVLFLLCLGLRVLPALASEAGPHLHLVKGQKLTGDFVLTHQMAGVETPMTSQGHFEIAPGEQIVWAVEKPMAMTATVRDGTLGMSIGQQQLFSIAPKQMPLMAELESDLVLAMNGEWSKLDKAFIVKRTGNANGWESTLVPRDTPDAPKPFQKLVARGSHFVESADVYFRKNTDHVTFSNQKVSAAP